MDVSCLFKPRSYRALAMRRIWLRTWNKRQWQFTLKFSGIFKDDSDVGGVSCLLLHRAHVSALEIHRASLYLISLSWSMLTRHRYGFNRPMLPAADLFPFWKLRRYTFYVDSHQYASNVHRRYSCRITNYYLPVQPKPTSHCERRQYQHSLTLLANRAPNISPGRTKVRKLQSYLSDTQALSSLRTLRRELSIISRCSTVLEDAETSREVATLDTRYGAVLVWRSGGHHFLSVSFYSALMLVVEWSGVWYSHQFQTVLFSTSQGLIFETKLRAQYASSKWPRRISHYLWKNENSRPIPAPFRHPRGSKGGNIPWPRGTRWPSMTRQHLPLRYPHFHSSCPSSNRSRRAVPAAWRPLNVSDTVAPRSSMYRGVTFARWWGIQWHVRPVQSWMSRN